MKTIKFRPLRRVKKTGKITVASYMQWRKVQTADYFEFNLLLEPEYQSFNKDEFVYDHKGEQLFWYNHQNPDSLPKNYADIEMLRELVGDELDGELWKLSEPMGIGFASHVHGFDCDGVPVFSHYTANYIATHYKDVNVFEPLTVGLVVKWVGWFLYRLQNSRLQK